MTPTPHPLWDGHSHTQFCAHGSGDRAELMIEQAIALGFTRYSLTEHAPLPPGLLADAKLQLELALAPELVMPYLAWARGVKERYQGQIEVLVGLEVDYLHGHEDYTRQFLNEFGPLLDDALLSLHFLPGVTDYEMLDFSKDDLLRGLLPRYGSLGALHDAYWDALLASALADLGRYKPKRLGHPGLIYKFRKELDFGDLETHPPPAFARFLKICHEGGYSLDNNMGGTYKASCGQPYLPAGLCRAALAAQVPLVYGSDAHSTKAVEQAWKGYETHCQHD